MRPRTTVSLLVVLLLLGALVFPSTVRAAPSAEGQTDVTEATTSTTELPPAEMIPRPNSGVAPADAGDRGGGLQTLVFALVMGGTGLIGFLVWRESKKARAARGF